MNVRDWLSISLDKFVQVTSFDRIEGGFALADLFALCSRDKVYQPDDLLFLACHIARVPLEGARMHDSVVVVESRLMKSVSDLQRFYEVEPEKPKRKGISARLIAALVGRAEETEVEPLKEPREWKAFRCLCEELQITPPDAGGDLRAFLRECITLLPQREESPKAPET